MFGSISTIGNFCENLNLIELNNVKIAFFPPIIYLDLASRILNKSHKLGIQDFSFCEKTNLTGDVSFEMAKEFGISYAIIGHSERISNYSEEYSRINDKLKILKGENVVPVICFGEKSKLPETEFTLFASEFLLYTLNSVENFDNVFLAYEPVWAIGAGEIDDMQSIVRNISIIKELLIKYDLQKVKLLYGGSVNDMNIVDIENKIAVDGYLIGSAGRDFNCVKNILKNVK